MKITYVSKPGKNKTESQDCILINDQVINNHAGILDTPLKRVCIADGVGGVPGGFDASNFVLKHFIMDKSFNNGKELKERLIRINDELISFARNLGEKRSMATTFSGLARIDKSIWVMHAGNTRIYAFKDGRLMQLTDDHTNYRAMVRDGVVDPSQEYMGKNVIYCCFGTGRREYLNALEVRELHLDGNPELVMLTSDGIHDYVDNDSIEKILKENLDNRNRILALLDQASANGSEDDCTVIMASSR